MTPGERAYALVERLYPICRSITGDGVRETLSIVGEHLPVERHEVPSGTQVLDWTVPPEWNVRAARLTGPDGSTVVDLRDHTLHVVNYAEPVDLTLDLDELQPHLHSLPDRPDSIPYRTSYYDRSWGFCLPDRVRRALPPGRYHAVIDATLAPGHLSYGEVVVPGRTEDEILISTHVCHPSLADDNLSGISVAVQLARRLLDGPTPHHTVRFVYAPGTIGAITWLARNREGAHRVRHGLTLTCLGDAHPFTYKRTLAGDAPVDRAAAHVLTHSGLAHEVIDFFPYGYDERQYNSPGFRLPVGSLMRGRHGRFPEYHTSADDLSFVSAARLDESFTVLAAVVDVLDRDRTMVNLQPYGEPQLGSRGLYGALGGTAIPDAQMAMLWVLTLSDGTCSLLDVAERAGLPFASVADTAAVLEKHDLLREV